MTTMKYLIHRLFGAILFHEYMTHKLVSTGFLQQEIESGGFCEIQNGICTKVYGICHSLNGLRPLSGDEYVINDVLSGRNKMKYFAMSSQQLRDSQGQ